MKIVDQLILDENNIAFYPMMGNSYQLNDISKDIITMMKLQKSKDEIIKELLEKYDVSYDEIFIDVSDLFSKMKIYGLI